MKTQNILIALLFVLSPLLATSTTAQYQAVSDALYGEGAPLENDLCKNSGDPLWDLACTAVFNVFGADASFATPYSDDYRADGDGHMDHDQDGRPDAAQVPGDGDEFEFLYVHLDYFFNSESDGVNDDPFNLDDSTTEFDFGLQPYFSLPTNRNPLVAPDQVRLAGPYDRGDKDDAELPIIYELALYDNARDFCHLCLDTDNNVLVLSFLQRPDPQGNLVNGNYDLDDGAYEASFDFDATEDSIEERDPSHAKTILRMQSSYVYQEGQAWADGHRTVLLGEKHVKIALPSQQDVDDDGWTDGLEADCGSNPTRHQSTCDDLDGDGMPNSQEEAVGRDPRQNDDLDGDGVFNSIDNCNPGEDEPNSPARDVGRSTDNPDQKDLDSDGIGDHCDGDIDGDGLHNNHADEDFPLCDQGTRDNDGDGMPDVRVPGSGACDVTLYPSGLVEDLDDDNDGIDDAGVPGVTNHAGQTTGDDNCQFISNPDQDNTDYQFALANNRHATGDAAGDVCDGDIDGDGASNGDDPNDFEPDMDFDGLSDGYEIGDGVNCFPVAGCFDENADEGNPDTDGDGLSDCQEVLHTVLADCVDPTNDGSLFDGGYGTDPNNPDTDGDLISDGQEVADGTDPNDPLSPGVQGGAPSGVPDPFQVLTNPDCTDSIIANGDGTWDQAACGNGAGFVDDFDPWDEDGDGVFDEPNGQVDIIEQNLFFYDDASNDEGGQTTYTARFKGDDSMTFVYFEDPTGDFGSPHKNVHVVSAGDARDTQEQEMLVIETTYAVAAAERSADLQGVPQAGDLTYGASEVLCVVDEGGTPVLYTGTQKFNEANADHPCGQPYTWADTSNEFGAHRLSNGLVWGAGWWAFGSYADDPTWDEPFIRVTDEDRDNVPEVIEVGVLDPDSPGCDPTGLDDGCGVSYIPILGGVPDPGAGVEDSDGDDVPDAVDECPDEAGHPANGGCPEEPADADGDGVPDADDRCPGTESGATVDAEGCADGQTPEDPPEDCGGIDAPELGCIDPGAGPNPNELCDEGQTFPECLLTGNPAEGCLDDDETTECVLDDLPAGVSSCEEAEGDLYVCTGPDGTTVGQVLLGEETWPGLEVRLPILGRFWI